MRMKKVSPAETVSSLFYVLLTNTFDGKVFFFFQRGVRNTFQATLLLHLSGISETQQGLTHRFKVIIFYVLQ